MSLTIFQDGTVWSKSLLDMINTSLLSIGETPFVEGTDPKSIPLGTDGETASRIIKRTMIEVQARGWYFNTDYDFELVPDTNGFIAMPPNTLKVDFGYTAYPNRYVLKNGQIYDVEEKTFYIGKKLKADIIWLVDYQDLPPEAYEYIALRAARKFQQSVIGSTELAQFTGLDEQDALINLQRLQLQLSDYRLRNDRVNTRIHNGYLVEGLYGASSRRKY